MNSRKRAEMASMMADDLFANIQEFYQHCVDDGRILMYGYGVAGCSRATKSRILADIRRLRSELLLVYKEIERKY